MKLFHVIKRVMIYVTAFLVMTLVIIDQPPVLPSSRPIITGGSGAEVRTYIFENFFAIVCFMFSIFVGCILEVYGLFMCRNIKNLKDDGNAAVLLGLFVLDSGIWIITDSKILTVFTTNYGGMLNINSIVFVSYISFMLLPIIFTSFIRCILGKGRWLHKIDGLFILNLAVFTVLSFFHLPKEVYFILLMIHHVLIYAVVIIGVIYCIRSFRDTVDMQKKILFRGLLCFMSFGGCALIVFSFGFSRVYAVMYCIGFYIMMWYMIKLVLHKVLSAYDQSVKNSLYQSMAYADILTGLKNRNAFIEEQYERSVDESICCIVIDINRLKCVNDTFGHSYGDELIRCSAKVVDDFFSDIGNCYRIGGDEFAVVCQDCDENFVEKTIEKMRRCIAEKNLLSEAEISLACGYAFGGNGIYSFKDLFNAADKKMYFDKNERTLL